MNTHKSLFGAVLGAALLASNVEAHECRALGQVNNQINQYWLCVGFAIEDGDRPRAGTSNNVDVFAVWVTPTADEYLDTRKGDLVDIKVRLSYLTGDYYEVPHDENYNVTDPYFFFKVNRTGFENPLGSPKYVRDFHYLVRQTLVEEGETFTVYRAPFGFETPYPGLYSFLVEGTIKRKGLPPVSFTTKWVSAQPRVPYGPNDANGSNISDLGPAPEGWFDAVRPGNKPHAQTFAAGKRFTPSMAAILQRIRDKFRLGQK